MKLVPLCLFILFFLQEELVLNTIQYQLEQLLAAAGGGDPGKKTSPNTRNYTFTAHRKFDLVVYEVSS